MAQHNRKDDDGTQPLRNIKHEMFCQEYMMDFFGTDAYIRVGYKVKNRNVARTESSKLLANPIIQRRIAFLSAGREKQVIVDKTFVIEGFKEIAKRSMQATPVMEWDEEKKCYVEKKELVENGEGVMELRTVYAYNAKEANKAFENIAKYGGVVQEVKKVVTEHSGVVGVAEVPLTVEEMKEKALKMAKYLGESAAKTEGGAG